MSSGVDTATRSGATSVLEVGAGDRPSMTQVLEIVASSLAEIDRLADRVPVEGRLAVLAAVRTHCDTREAVILAQRLEAGATARSVETLLQGDGRTSKRSAKTRTRRAKAVQENPGIASRMASGDLSADQTDVIATASRKTDGAAGRDEELLDRISATTPDQAKKIADEWVQEHTSNADVQDEHDRQRRLRCVRRWTSDRDTDVLSLEGDTASIDRIERAIRSRSRDLYRADGGRDVPTGEHRRTRDQRNFDAAVELLTRKTPSNGSDTGPAPSSSSRPAPRNTVVVAMTLDQATGADPTPVRLVGGGLLAPTVLHELFCDADFVGLITDRSGLPLWLGRRTRDFTHQQWLALIARDQGCSQCGAHYSECHAHHIIPWNAPARGPTDIDNATLLCTDCHQRVHDANLILVRDPDTGTWTTRPATPRETAPKRPRVDTSGRGRPSADARPDRPNTDPPPRTNADEPAQHRDRHRARRSLVR